MTLLHKCHKPMYVALLWKGFLHVQYDGCEKFKSEVIAKFKYHFVHVVALFDLIMFLHDLLRYLISGPYLP